MSKITCVCSNCRKTVQRYPNEIEGKKNIYCSKKCHSEHKRGMWNGSKNPRWSGGLKERECPHCHSKFISSVITSKFCSKECADTSRRKRSSFVCEQCGISFEREDALVRSHEGIARFCSLACMGRSEE